jgi:2-dehydropantoate 2-reductase
MKIMTILVMGSGAVGGCYGGMLSNAGEDVTFVARGLNLATINEKGLRVESNTAGDFVVHPKAVERPDGTWKADLVLFCVKGYHNVEAMNVIAPAIGDETAILTLQNGIGGGDQLASRFGSDKVLLGAAYIDAMRKGPGVVADVGNSMRISFGERNGDITDRAMKIEGQMKNAGIDVLLSDNVLKVLWNKLVYICALSGMTCITRASFEDVLRTPETLAMTEQVMQEAYSVGKASGGCLDSDLVKNTLAGFLKEKDFLSSMYLDLVAGNPLELDVLNGAVSKKGWELGIPTPANDFITSCLRIVDNKGREAK